MSAQDRPHRTTEDLKQQIADQMAAGKRTILIEPGIYDLTGPVLPVIPPDQPKVEIVIEGNWEVSLDTTHWRA